MLDVQTSVVIDRDLEVAADDERPADAQTSRAAVPVCHVSMCLATGGLERLLVEFSRLHDAARYRPQFVALGDLGRPAEDIRANGCEAGSLEFGRHGRLAILRSLADRLRASRTQIVHTHNTYAHFYGTLAARLARVPVVINTQHGRGCGPTWKHRVQFRIANRQTQRIVAVSDDAAALCRGEDPRSAHKIIRIWNGIDVHRFRERDPALRPDGPTAISVSRLSPEKDVATLLRAVREVVREVPDFQLQLVGDGPVRGSLQRLTAELGLCECVEFLGERADVPALLARAGFFVSSSRSEGVSLTLLEAAAVGLPIVTTSVGGNPEVVAEGRSGFLAPPQQPSALAAAIVRMCKSRDRWTRMGRHGRDRVQTHFEVGRMVRAYETLYQELLAFKT